MTLGYNLALMAILFGFLGMLVDNDAEFQRLQNA